MDKSLNKSNIHESCSTINLSLLILNTSIPVFAERYSVHNTMIDDIFIILPSLASVFHISWGAELLNSGNCTPMVNGVHGDPHDKAPSSVYPHDQTR